MWVNKTILTWRFFLSSYQNWTAIAKKAFDIWSEHTNLKFKQVYHTRQDILISITPTNALHVHQCIHTNLFCQYPFRPGVLGHAFYPEPNKNITEIHINGNIIESWTNADSLLNILLHEIGHALGIEHVQDPNSIMYPYGNSNNHKLSQYDIMEIQSRYGVKKATTTTSTTTTTTTTKATTTKAKTTAKAAAVTSTTTATTTKAKTTAKAAVITSTTKATITNATTTTTPTTTTTAATTNENSNSLLPDICDIKKNLHTFLILNDMLYIFHEKWVWIKSLLEHDKYNSKPMIITEWLPFLPKNFTKVSAIYQRPNTNVILISDETKGYEIEFPSLASSNQIYFGHSWQITGAVNTNTGRSFLFYNNEFYSERSECDLRHKVYGNTAKTFSGIPSVIDGVFRYTNGRLYFFKHDRFYEYDEFTNTLVRAGKFDLSLFGIHCPNIGILEQLKSVLQKLYNHYNSSSSSN